MSNSKYSKIKVFGDVYCSSSVRHFIGVEYNVGERLWSRRYCIEDDDMRSDDGMYLKPFPSYFMRAIYAQLIDRLPTCRIYEYNQNSDEYDTVLRYHQPSWIAKTVIQLKDRLAALPKSSGANKALNMDEREEKHVHIEVSREMYVIPNHHFVSVAITIEYDTGKWWEDREYCIDYDEGGDSVSMNPLPKRFTPEIYRQLIELLSTGQMIDPSDQRRPPADWVEKALVWLKKQVDV